LWLLAELTYRCPLHCVYCSNPMDYASRSRELDTGTWLRVLREGRALGAVQLGLSGGEPLLRDDLTAIISEARALGFYSNLITSGVGLTQARIRAFRDAGLDHIQVSFQDSTRDLNDYLGRARTFELKKRVARLVKDHGFPMVLNVVLHRMNIDHVEDILDMADALGADYVELANTQYYGWAYENRDRLLPTQAQVARAEDATRRFRDKVGGRMRVLFVVPDYFERRPKACMNGWGSVFVTVTPDGTVLPCHAARMLPGLAFPSVTTAGLAEIWYDSDAFNRYRGDAWMREPCRSCPEKGRDFGGCRCQAYLLTGDAANADPVCDLSPHHARITEALVRAHAPGSSVRPIVFRDDRNSRTWATRPSIPG
jgi:pyrroloquinoline quinone biosynthesis protein E